MTSFETDAGNGQERRAADRREADLPPLESTVARSSAGQAWIAASDPTD